MKYNHAPDEEVSTVHRSHNKNKRGNNNMAISDLKYDHNGLTYPYVATTSATGSNKKEKRQRKERPHVIEDEGEETEDEDDDRMLLSSFHIVHNVQHAHRVHNVHNVQHAHRVHSIHSIHNLLDSIHCCYDASVSLSLSSSSSLSSSFSSRSGNTNSSNSNSSNSNSITTTSYLPTKKSRRGKRRDHGKSSVPFDPTRKPKASSIKKNKNNNSSSNSSSNSSNNNNKKNKKSETSASSSSQRRRTAFGSVIEVRLPGQTELVRKHRVIHFNEEVTVREVRSAKSLINNDRFPLWFQCEEQAEIKNNIYKVLSHVDDTGISHTTGRRYCTRGLERFMKPEECYLPRSRAADAVFLEQFVQKEHGTFDSELLAKVYRQSTRKSRRVAAQRGISDATVAQTIQGVRFRQQHQQHQQQQQQQRVVSPSPSAGPRSARQERARIRAATAVSQSLAPVGAGGGKEMQSQAQAQVEAENEQQKPRRHSIADDSPCPIHPPGTRKQTWGQCYHKAFAKNPNRPNRNNDNNDAHPEQYMCVFINEPEETLPSTPWLDRFHIDMEADAKYYNKDLERFPINEAKTFNSDNNEDNVAPSNDKDVDLAPTTVSDCNSINGVSGKYYLKTLSDSRSTDNLIVEAAIPSEAKKHLLDQPIQMQTAKGRATCNRY
eukprot:jgi/Psemu1/5429/gm1.5429_g